MRNMRDKKLLKTEKSMRQETQQTHHESIQNNKQIHQSLKFIWKVAFYLL